MNRIYKVIWSKARNCYVVVSEIAKTHSKGGTGVSGVVRKAGSAALLTAAVTAMLLTPLGTASAAAVDISSNSDGSATAVFQNSNNGIKIGDNTISASGDDSIAIGTNQTDAAGRGSVAIGSRAKVDAAASRGTAVGDSAYATERDSSAYGSGAEASGTESTAIGHDSDASGTSAAAIGNAATASGADSFAAGYDSTASGGSSIAIGEQAVGSGGSSSAVGAGSEASGQASTALGAGSDATATNATATGSNAVASETNATAIGTSAGAKAEDSTALGSGAIADNKRAVALGGGGVTDPTTGEPSGNSAQAHGEDSIAIGSGSRTAEAAASSVAIGGGGEDQGANAAAEGAVAVGTGTSASGVNSVAIGGGDEKDGANASADGAVALGNNSKATVENGVALGAGSIASTGKDIEGYVPNPNRVPDTTISTWTSTEAAVSIGATDESGNPTMTRQITGVAAGTNDWDAANVAQLKAAMTHYYSINDDPIEQPNYNNDGATGKNAMAAGIGASATGNLSVALGTYAKANGLNSIAIGSAQVKTKIDPETGKVIIDSVSEPTTANGQNALAVGYYNTATGNNSTAVGSVNTTNGDIASAIGHYNQATAYGASAIGNTNRASAPDSSAIGKNNTASNSYANAIGGSNSAGGQYSSAIGHYNQTSSYASNANAIGDNNEASASEASAIGHHNSASAGNANAIGDNNYASGQYSTAVGHYNHASGQDSSALGDNNYAYGNLSSAVGHYNYAYGGNSSAIGDNNKAYNSNSSAIGAMNTANSAQSSAIGHYNTASAEYATAMGENNQATGYGASAIGKNNYANGSQSTAIGNTNTANASDSVAVGKYNTASSDNASAIGTTNTASGQYSTAVGHYNTASAQDASALGSNNYAEAYQSNAVGHYNHATAANANALGDNNWATAQAASAIGQVNTASGSQSTAVGHYNRATAGNTTAVGENNLAEAESATAVGKNNIASNYAASAVGFNNTAKGSFSSALGTNATAEKYGSIAIGGNGTVNHYISDGTELDGTELTLKKDSSGNDIYTYIDADGNEIQYTNTSAIVSGSAVAKGNNAVVLGAESVANVDGSVALGAFSKADRGPEQEDGYDPFGEAHDGSPTWRATAAAVSVGGKTFTNDDGEEVTYTRQITNVAAGREDTDAVNVAQLKTLAKTIESAGDHYFSADDYVPAGTDDDGNPTEEQNVIKRVHGQRLAVIGDAKTTTDPESGEEVTQANIVTSVVAGDATTGTLNTIKIELGRDLDVDTVVVNGKDGKDGLTIKGADGAPGTIGMAGKDGEIKTITLNGKDGEDGSPGVDGESITRLIVDEHEVATLDDGLKFGANAPEEEEGDNPVANKLNSTVKIVGVDAKEDHEYSADNLTTTVKQAEDGTTTITVMMDKDPEFDTLVVNGKDGAPGEPGTPGSIGMKGEDGEIKTVTITTEGAPGVDGKDGETITRLIVDDKPVATLDDGMKYSGDFGNTNKNPVAVKLNKNVDVVGNATAKSADDLTDGNIGVVAEPEIDEETGEATGNAKLTIKLNKDINLGPDGSLTVGGEVDEEGNPKTDEYGNPTSIKIGPQEVYNINGGPETGDYIIGLDNKTWDPTNIVSGRAATEDQLAAVQTHYYSVNDIVDGEQVIQDNWDNKGATGKFALAAGTNAKAEGESATAVGNNAKASSLNSTAIGFAASADVADSVAIGSYSKANYGIPTEAGYDVATDDVYAGEGADSATWKATAGEISVGGKTETEITVDGQTQVITTETTRQIKNVAAGSDDTDAVNVAQLRRLAGAIQIHDYSVNSIEPAKDLNYDNKGATGDNAMAAGVNAIAEGANSTAVGNMAIARNENSTAVGNKALASADSAVAIGDDAQANIENSVAIGSGARTVEVVGTPSYEIGGTTYKFAGAEPVGTVSVGTADEKRTITNVAAGRISEESTDAINGSQLWAVTEAMKSGHTEVTVGEGTPAGEGEGVYNTGGNLDLNVTQAEDGHNIYDLKLAKDIDVDTIVVNGKDGKDGKIGINGKDGETSYITVSGKDGAPGVDGVTTTRILIDDKPVATLDDGLKYTGDFGDGAAVKLNKTVNVVGNAASKDDLVDGNIGVTADQNGEDGKLTIKLNKDIDLGDEGSITFGDVHIHDGDEISFGDNVIHNVAPGVEDYDVVNVSQLKQYSAAARTEVSVGDVRVTEDGTPVTGGNLELKRTKDENDEHDIYDVRLAKDIDVDTIVVNGKDGKDGAVGLTGKDGVTRTITITKDGAPGLDGKDGEVRIVYEDGEHNTHEVATLDDGLKFGANKPEANSGNPVANKLNSTINILGEEPAEGTVYSTKNLTTTVDQDEDGNTTILVKMNRDLDVDTIVVNGKDGKDGKIGINGKDGETSYITVSGKDGAPGVDGVTTTRILIDDKPVATLDDGLKYAGDFGDGAAVKLNNTVNVKGEAENEEDLTDGNIGVVANQNANGKDADLIIKLNKDIDLTPDGSVTMGDTVINNDGLTINEGPSFTKNKIDVAGNKIINVAPGEDGTDAVNVDQLKEYSGKAKTEVTVGGGVKAGTDGNYATGGNLDLAVSTDPDDGHEIYDLKLADNIELGGPGKDGKDGVNGSIGVNGADGKSGVGIDGENGITVYGKDGKDGEPAVAINGKDGIGHIGLAGKDGKDADITIGRGYDGERGEKGANGVDGLGGEDGITRIIYTDPDGTEHQVATMDDGMKYSGDFGNTKDDPVPVKLNNIVDIVGESTAASEDELSDGNIGVVAKADGDGAKLVVKLNKNIDLTEEGSVTMGDTVINNDGLTINEGPSFTKNKIDVAGNKIINVAPGEDGTDAVNVDQLKEYSGKAKTEVTVGGGVKAGTDGNYATGGNLDLAVSTDPDDGHEIYDLKLADNIELGGPGKDGKDGVNGSIGVNGADGKSGVGIDGENGITVYGKDGKDGEPAVAINGKDGIGHIGLAGKDGKDADITIGRGYDGERGEKGANGVDGLGGEDGITRIIYTDPDGTEHQVATMDDGLKFGANAPAEGYEDNPVPNKLNSTISIVGEGEKEESSYSGKNLKTFVSQENGDTTITVKMDKDLETDTVVINGKDGKDGLTIKGADGEPGSIGMAGKDGEITHITINNDGKPGVDGKDGITRIEYKDPEGNDHEVATLDDGMKYGGDTGDVIAKKLNEQVNVIGGITDESKLTETDNIGVVSDGTDNLKVRLAKDIDLGKEGSVTIGDTTINNEGLTINEGPSVTKNGIDAGSKKITNVAPGEADTDAVNVSQLKDFAGDVNRNIGDVNNRINRLGDRVDKVGAGAAALAGLHPLDFDPDAKWDVAAGYGHYRGENAVAVGAFYRPSEDVMVNVASTVGNGDNMISAGVSVKVGGNTHVSNSRVALSKQVLEMRKEIEDLRSLMADSAFGKQLDLSKLQLFPDTPENHWAYDYVATLAGNGLLEGYPDGNFKGNRALTRYEVAAILYRAMLNGAQLTQRALEEFAPELDRIRVDTLTRHSDGTPSIQRVRIIKDRR